MYDTKRAVCYIELEVSMVRAAGYQANSLHGTEALWQDPFTRSKPLTTLYKLSNTSLDFALPLGTAVSHGRQLGIGSAKPSPYYRVHSHTLCSHEQHMYCTNHQ